MNIGLLGMLRVYVSPWTLWAIKTDQLDFQIESGNIVFETFLCKSSCATVPCTIAYDLGQHKPQPS